MVYCGLWYSRSTRTIDPYPAPSAPWVVYDIFEIVRLHFTFLRSHVTMSYSWRVVSGRVPYDWTNWVELPITIKVGFYICHYNNFTQFPDLHLHTFHGRFYPKLFWSWGTTQPNQTHADRVISKHRNSSQLDFIYYNVFVLTNPLP